MNEIFFNELCIQPRQTKQSGNDTLIQNFAECGRYAREKGFKICRVPETGSIYLSRDFSLRDWMAQAAAGKNRQVRDFLYSFLRNPFEGGDTKGEEDFIQRTYSLDEPGSAQHGQQAEGLAWADIYDTFAISLKTDDIWDKPEIAVRINTAKEELHKHVKHISGISHFGSHAVFIENLIPVNPQRSDIPPGKKTIHLRNDHGIHILEDFAKKLCNSEYITEIINSLPFCPGCSKFIKKVYADGKIELILNWYDTGYGLIIQTTGKTQRETEYIADCLAEKYGRI